MVFTSAASFFSSYLTRPKDFGQQLKTVQMVKRLESVQVVKDVEKLQLCEAETNESAQHKNLHPRRNRGRSSHLHFHGK